MTESISGASSNEAQQPPRNEVEAAVEAAADYLADLDLDELFASRPPDEITEDGNVYLIDAPEVAGDLAIVDARQTPLSTAHTHRNGEFDSVIMLRGSAILAEGKEIAPLVKGDKRIVEPGATHFVISEGAVFGALGYPNYNPDNQIPVDPTNPPEDFNAELYAKIQSDTQ